MVTAQVDPGNFDPVRDIARAALALLVAGAVNLLGAQLGLVQVDWALRGLVCLLAGYLVWIAAQSVALACRVSAAIQHLPGPKLNHLGVRALPVSLLTCVAGHACLTIISAFGPQVVEVFAHRPGLHRAITELADEYGPIFKLSALFYRVCCCCC